MLSGNALVENSSQYWLYSEVFIPITYPGKAGWEEAINSVSDDARWILKDEIPFIRLIRFIPQEMKLRLPALYHKALDSLVRMSLLGLQFRGADPFLGCPVWRQIPPSSCRSRNAL
jgi:hypothetical protein